MIALHQTKESEEEIPELKKNVVTTDQHMQVFLPLFLMTF